jgi:hypothetical protein
MEAEVAYRGSFSILFGGLLLMRGCFSMRVLRAGERLLPDQEAVECKGQGALAVGAAEA